jgi:asparagine synthase (glutamine-hydrolysing)
MCGIVGIIDWQMPMDTQKEILLGMVSTLGHRGPDGRGLFVSPGAALGHTRLSIIDLKSGAQPFQIDRFVMVYNGEVYNYVEIRKELEKINIPFYTKSDTEVVLRAFAYWGTDCFNKFNGQFALLIWDRYKRELIAARDRFGVRPLYIAKQKSSIYFSSELKAFDTIAGFNRTYEMQNFLEHGMLWNTIGDKTIYQDIRALAAGSVEVYNMSGLVKRYQYYTLGQTYSRYPYSYEQAKEELQEKLLNSVKLRLRSDVPVGVYLSGGIDSAIIAHLNGKASSQTFETFSVAFSDKQFDESIFQNEMATQIGSKHHTENINYDSINRNFLDTIYHIERPVFRSAPTPLYLLAKKVREANIKVVLTGEAADEIFFGYDSFKEIKILQFWAKQPSSKFRPHLIKRLYPHLQHYADSKQFGFIKMYYEKFLGSVGQKLAGLNIRMHNNKVIRASLNKDFGASISIEKIAEDMEASLPNDFGGWTNLQQHQYLEMKTLLSGYLLSSQGDRISLSQSVEGRYPFLDHELVDFAFSLPDSFKMRGLSQKHILRDSFNGLIPKSIINRPKLPYQAPDLKSFFKNGKLYGSGAEFLSSHMIAKYGVFDQNYVKRFLNKFKDRTPEQIGYRDNMLLVFMLSSQMACFWSENQKFNPQETVEGMDVEINDYTNELRPVSV